MRKILETIPLIVALLMLYAALHISDRWMEESCSTDTECEEAYGDGDAAYLAIDAIGLALPIKEQTK